MVVLHRNTGHALVKTEYLLQAAIQKLLMDRLHKTTGHGLLAMTLFYSLLLRSFSSWLKCTRTQDTLWEIQILFCRLLLGAAHGLAAQDMLLQPCF